ncbi:hypothetical protein [Mucilaginibacter antarcticus]|uniref:hypothetical protein n=1 Tax=Mucilaginibacter antarcticus TaxID=1855725 RepID=UPI00363F7F9F
MEYRSRKFHATGQACGYAVFSQHSHAFLLQGKSEKRLDQYLQRFPRYHGHRHPGSGKSFSIVNPFIRQLIGKEFAVCLYDFKFPDLGHIAYYHYLLAKQNGKLKGFAFHVINLNDIERSRRINPWRADYIKSLADAAETAEALVEALKKGTAPVAVTSSLRNLLLIF